MKTTAAIALLALLLAGCAPATRVVLLPQEGGRPSAVEVETATTKQRLTAPYQQADVNRKGAIEVEQTTEPKVRQRYRQMLAAQPEATQRFTLYFMPGGSQLTPESEAQLTDILSRATARPGGEIVVVGHTDTTGPTEANDALSLQRARAIRELIITRGFAAERVDAAGRGERELMVPTGDEVDEPKNRRAEIMVR